MYEVIQGQNLVDLRVGGRPVSLEVRPSPTCCKPFVVLVHVNARHGERRSSGHKIASSHKHINLASGHEVQLTPPDPT